jgi:hypothetical protein
VVDDEEDLNEILSSSLLEAGYVPVSAFTLANARAEVKTGLYCLVLLDLTLPDGDGITLLREIRESQPKLPVIVLSARVSEDDIDLGLEIGATDYLGKPFRVKELILRCNNILARSINDKITYSYKSCSLDTKLRKVFINSLEIKLTHKEYQLLSLLLRNQDKLLSRSIIYESIWGVIEEPDYHRLEAIVSNLRKKLKAHGFIYIKTNSKSGYSLE